MKPFTPKPGRIGCCVPFCRRTAKAGDSTEIICGKHWRAADRRLTRAYKRLHRALNRAMDRDPESLTEQELSRVRARLGVADAMWAKIKRQAIEAAVGLG